MPPGPEPDRDIRHQHPEIGDDEGNDEDGADGEATDAAILGCHQRGPVAHSQQPGADGKAAKLEKHQQDGKGRSKALRSNSAGETERDAAGQNAILAGRGA